MAVASCHRPFSVRLAPSHLRTRGCGVFATGRLRRVSRRVIFGHVAVASSPQAVFGASRAESSSDMWLWRLAAGRLRYVSHRVILVHVAVASSPQAVFGASRAESSSDLWLWRLPPSPPPPHRNPPCHPSALNRGSTGSATAPLAPVPHPGNRSAASFPLRPRARSTPFLTIGKFSVTRIHSCCFST